MKTSIMSLALGIVLSGSVAAGAAERPARPSHSHRTIHHRAVVRHKDPVASPTPAAFVPYNPFKALIPAARADPPPAARPWRDPFIPREKDGLSSDPNACVNYGCVGAGGGGD
jgi:hypothetical protein